MRCPFQIPINCWRLMFCTDFLHCQLPSFKSPHEVCLAVEQEERHTRVEDPVSKQSYRATTGLHAAAPPSLATLCLSPSTVARLAIQSRKKVTATLQHMWARHHIMETSWRFPLNKCGNWHPSPYNFHTKLTSINFLHFITEMFHP